MTWSLVARADGAEAALRELQRITDACDEIGAAQASGIYWGAAELVAGLDHALVCQISTVGHVEPDGMTSFMSVTAHTRARPDPNEVEHG